jgi:uncharacterized protein (DUF1697 family)
MPALRSILQDAGFSDVATVAQSGNVVLGTDSAPDSLEPECERLISGHFGFEVPVIARSAEEMAAVVKRNPLREIATEPKRYQVSFLASELPKERLAELAALAREPERLVAIGRELYAWHPEGVARSKLWARLADRGIGVKATARNWNTVTALAELAAG